MLDVGVSILAGNVADMLLSANFPRKACRGNTRHTKRGPGTQFLCVVLLTLYRTHRKPSCRRRRRRKKNTGITATTAAADAAAAPPIEPYFGANGAATTRANNLPWLPAFQLFQGLAAATSMVAAGTSTAPATVSVPTELAAAARQGRRRRGRRRLMLPFLGINIP